MSKQLEDALLTNYASTRLNAEEKIQLVNIATQCGKKPGVVLREAFRFYAQYVLIDTQKKEGVPTQLLSFAPHREVIR